MKTPLILTLLLPLAAVAHPWTPPPPVSVPVPLSRDRANDLRDLRSVDGTVAELDRAAATRDLRLLRLVDARARDLLDEELRERRREVERARRWSSGRDLGMLRRAAWKLDRVARLDSGYRQLDWRIDPASVAQRRGILMELDRLDRDELAGR